jgi:SH3 domain-containing YSC84-like protein 1
MKKAVLLPLVLLFSISVFAQSDRAKVLERVSDAGTVLNEIMSAPDAGIPDNVMGSAQCVAVVP